MLKTTPLLDVPVGSPPPIETGGPIFMDWKAKWIGGNFNNWRRNVLPAPHFRKMFEHHGATKNSIVAICGLGYYELYINGSRIGDHVLDPGVTHYDRRARYVTHEVGDYLVEGTNVAGVILGNGWYNCHTPEVWNFDKASWRDDPKLLLQLEQNGKLLLGSDETWNVSAGPIVFDGLRNGETYDARLELDGWASSDFDDSTWTRAAIVPGPGGVLQKQTMPPCKVMRTLPVAKQWRLSNGDLICDFGQNMSGWARITCSGARGAELTLAYAEKLKDGGDITQENINTFIKGGECQTDHYFLKGDGVETWEPRFTYHGFRYLRIRGLSDNLRLEKVEGRVVHTAFERIGTFACSNEVINRLQECTAWSYVSNFTGIPTDCPHREKNGWTGDAHLAAETGLMNFAAGSAYTQWLDSFADVQRPNGQLPGIVPSAGWGFNWGSGPAWDSAFLLIPWYVYLYTGEASAILAHYESMKKYVEYCGSMATDHIVSFGLGDWCHINEQRIVTAAFTSTAFYHADCLLMSKFATIAGRSEDCGHFKQLAGKIKEAFNKLFYKENGVYANGEQTALACALYQGLVEDSERQMVVAKLAEAVRANDFKPDFGILGAKYVPRVLADTGHADLAYQVITQPDFPGWAHWLEQGATTLWENWNGEGSQNHIMFGDVSAWFYSVLAGIIPEQPGFKHFSLRPQIIEGLTWVRSEYRSPYGLIRSSWKIDNHFLQWDILVPANTTATVCVPADANEVITGGGDSPADGSAEVRFLHRENGNAVFRVQSGAHTFRTKTSRQ